MTSDELEPLEVESAMPGGAMPGGRPPGADDIGPVLAEIGNTLVRALPARAALVYLAAPGPEVGPSG